MLARMGADLTVTPTGDRRVRAVCRSGPLRGVTVTPSEIPDLIDEIPVLAVAAATADGPTRFEGAGELRHKESDRLRSVLAGLAALGAPAEVDGDTLVVHGGAQLRAGRVEAAGDHRIAMAFCIGALAATGGETIISGWRSVATSYPGFLQDLARCRES